ERLEEQAKQAVQRSQRQVFPEGAWIPEVARGRKTQIVLPSGKTLDATYALVSLKDVIASHKPQEGFVPNEDYIWTDDKMGLSPLQPNDYANNAHRQDETKSRAASPKL